MIILKDAASLKEERKKLDATVGFVPTMGALHEGHISLIKRAKEENKHVIVSIFVNPTQFLEGEDLDKYPKRIEADILICKKAGVDILFLPTINDIYNKDELLISAPKIRGYILEGAKRPGHFDGVLQVVLKLFNITTPTNAYFGKKDAQQLVLITQMAKDYFLDTNIIACETIRDSKGLALSSRNVYLSEDEYKKALSLSASLRIAANLISKGEVDCKEIKRQMIEVLKPNVTKLDYVAIVDREFHTLEEIQLNNTIIAVAAFIGNTRLIDNLWI